MFNCYLSTRLEFGCVPSVPIGQELTIKYVGPTNMKAIRKSQRGATGFPNLRLKKNFFLTSGVCKLQPVGHIQPHPLVDVLSIIAYLQTYCLMIVI